MASPFWIIFGLIVEADSIPRSFARSSHLPSASSSLPSVVPITHTVVDHPKSIPFLFQTISPAFPIVPQLLISLIFSNILVDTLLYFLSRLYYVTMYRSFGIFLHDIIRPFSFVISFASSLFTPDFLGYAGPCTVM